MAKASQRGLPAKIRELKVYSVAELHEATGGFHRLCLIGEGGFGKVYRAMVQLTPVAIKVLDHAGLQGLKEFHNEMQLACSIQHPNVVKLLGYAHEGNCQCLVYELMAHGNLEDRLVRKNGVQGLAWPIRVKIAAQSTQALAYLHSRNIIHRDIKPANIFLDCNFNGKLGDIGLAAYDNVYAGVASRNQEAVGTWAYLAPEYKTQGRSSCRTDVYAIGLSLLQLAKGAAQPKDLIRRCQAALESGSLHQELDAHAGTWDVIVGERMVKLGLWCCMHDPEQRPTILTIHAELQRLVQQLQQQGLLPP